MTKRLPRSRLSETRAGGISSKRAFFFLQKDSAKPRSNFSFLPISPEHAPGSVQTTHRTNGDAKVKPEGAREISIVDPGKFLFALFIVFDTAEDS